MSSPSVTAVIPTYNSSRTLELALASLRAQRYDGEFEIFCVDGGSSDATRTIAAAHGARIIENPDRIQERGLARGIDAARSELVLLLDADDELPHSGWLARLVSALELGPDVVAADCLYHTARRSDPALTRLLGLIGGVDPVAIDLGWHERWAHHLDRWTGMPLLAVEDAGDALLVKFDPERTPPMGANGFLVRREQLLEVDYSMFVHPDVIARLVARGWRFARVKDTVIHHFAPGWRAMTRKAIWHAQRAIEQDPPRAQAPSLSRIRLVAEVLWSVTFVGPAWHALRGYRRQPDPAWAMYPLLHVIWTGAYVARVLAAALHRARFRGGLREARV